MLAITRYDPTLPADPEHDRVSFSSLDELLGIDFVRSRRSHEGFYQLSIDRRYVSRIPLIAEYLEGKKWAIIGYIEGDLSTLDLPDWSLSEALH